MTRTLLQTCLLASRPKTLPAALVPVWVGVVLAWKLSGSFDLGLALWTLGGAVSIQIATNFFNDAIDSQKGADTSRRLGPMRVTSAGLMRPSTVMALAGVFLVVATACGTTLYQARGWPIVFIGIPSLFLTYGYTGGPFPLAYRGMGELFVIFFFGLVAVSGTVFIQSGSWPIEALLLGFQTGLLSAVLISINNLRDRAEDSTTGKNTLAVRFGPRFAIATVCFEIMAAALLGLLWVAFDHHGLVFASLPVLVIGTQIMLGVLKLPPGRVFNRLLAFGGIQLILFASAFHLAAVLF